LGVTAIELMPVAQFPGGRNWGYDGVHPFAVQNTYGGPEGLRRLVDAAHSLGLAVVMDAVYNHVGPEGNYLADFGDYFTDRHHTPWGQAVNFDDAGSDEVRRFFIENALCWIDEYHIDALRLDAVHAIYDFSAKTFLRELADAVRLEGERLNRRVYTIAESCLNDTRLIDPPEQGGFGLDAQWSDDLHHALRTELTDERGGYYVDYQGFPNLAKAYRAGFVQDGTYSEYRRRRHGNSAKHVNPIKLVVCSQNHDQVGNRLLGERLTELVSFEQQKLAAASIILSPYLPMLFMGEEYAETAPFQFFISHTDPDLVRAVREGRKEEFARFEWNQEPPDPQDEATFLRCKLNHKRVRGVRTQEQRTVHPGQPAARLAGQAVSLWERPGTAGA
jgi:maltooligosyltrehalose trehalohydrolase